MNFRRQKFVASIVLLNLLAGCVSPQPQQSQPIASTTINNKKTVSNDTVATQQKQHKNTRPLIPKTPSRAVSNPNREQAEAIPAFNTLFPDSQAKFPYETITEPEADQQGNLWDALRQNFSLKATQNIQADVNRFEKHYRKRQRYFNLLSQRAYWYMPYIYAEIEKRNLPAELALIPAIESLYLPDAESPSKAKGIWQFIPSTGKHFNLKQNSWVDERVDVVLSTQAALDYLEYLNRFFKGDWLLTIAAYNAGEGTIQNAQKWNRKRGRGTDYGALSLRRETEEYIPRLLALRNVIQNPKNFGIALEPVPDWQTLAFIETPFQVDLSVIASMIGLSDEELRTFNSAYKLGVTPPNSTANLAVPMKYSVALAENLQTLTPSNAVRFAGVYIVQPGDSLGKIALKLGISLKYLKQINNISSNLIYPGQQLKTPKLAQQEQQTSKKKSIRKKYHIVRRGDTLWEIARNYGTSIARLAAQNNLSRNSTLKLGQRLVIDSE